MTGSWTLDAFIIGSIILLVVPLAVFIYREAIMREGGIGHEI